MRIPKWWTGRRTLAAAVGLWSACWAAWAPAAEPLVPLREGLEAAEQMAGREAWAAYARLLDEWVEPALRRGEPPDADLMAAARARLGWVLRTHARYPQDLVLAMESVGGSFVRGAPPPSRRVLAEALFLLQLTDGASALEEPERRLKEALGSREMNMEGLKAFDRCSFELLCRDPASLFIKRLDRENQKRLDEDPDGGLRCLYQGNGFCGGTEG